MAELDDPKLGNLYRKPADDSSLVPSTNDSSGAGQASGSSATEEVEYYRQRKQFWAIMKWFVPILLGLVATIGLGLWAVNIQSVVGPVGKLEGKVEDVDKDLDAMRQDIKRLESELNSLKAGQKDKMTN